MKRNLLYLASIMMFSVTTVNAQIQVWDFAGEAMGAGYTDMVTASLLNAVPTNGKNTAGAAASDPATTVSLAEGSTTATIGAFTLGDLSFTSNPNKNDDRIYTTNTAITRYDTEKSTPIPAYKTTPANIGRFAFNGKGTATQRNLSFNLQAGESITMIVKSETTSGSTIATPTIVASNGGTAITLPTFALATIVEIHFTAATAGSYKLYDATSKLSIYRIYRDNVTSALLGTNTFSKESDVTVYSNNNKVLFSNIKSKTSVSIYSLTGALVKSADVTEDSGLAVENGVYIVKLKSAEGEKSVKVLVQ